MHVQYWRKYVCMYRLEYMYQCIRINPTVIGKECKNKLYLESYICVSMCDCMSLSIYACTGVSMCAIACIGLNICIISV